MQITIGSPEFGQVVGVSNPWTEYVKMLPSLIPLPTMWTEEERVLLVGTSLEVGLYFLRWCGHDQLFKSCPFMGNGGVHPVCRRISPPRLASWLAAVNSASKSLR